jgi:predicted nucleotidyltransferase
VIKIMGTVDAAIESRALAAVEALSCLGVVRAACLFGSHVEGTADQWSDIDAAVFIEGVEQWDIHQRATAMALVMEKVGSEVEAHLFPASDLADPPRGGFAKYILHHGICIFEQQ